VLITSQIDTTAILSAYFATLEYNDTISDQSLNFYLKETVSQNRIISRETSYQWLSPVEQNTIKKYSTYIYSGLIFHQNISTNTSSIGITLNYSNEKLTGMVGYDPFNKSVFVGAGLKLFSW